MAIDMQGFMQWFSDPFSGERYLTEKDALLTKELSAEQDVERRIHERREQVEADLRRFPEKYERVLANEIDEVEELLDITHRLIKNEEIAVIFDIREPFHVVRKHIESFEQSDALDYLEEVMTAARSFAEKESGYFEDASVPVEIVEEDGSYPVAEVVADIRQRTSTIERVEERTEAVWEEIEAGKVSGQTVSELCAHCIDRIEAATAIVALATLVQKRVLEEYTDSGLHLSDASVETREDVEEYLQELREEDERILREEESEAITLRRYVDAMEDEVERLREQYS